MGMGNQKERLVTPQYIFVILMYFGNVFSLYYYGGMITSIAEGLGGSAVLAGLTSSVYSITPIFCRNIVGKLCDTWGRTKTNLVGVIINAACCIGYIFCGNIVALLIVRAIMGVGFCFTSVANYAAGSDVVPETRKAEGLGWFQNSASVSEYLGPALALFAVSATPGSYIGLHIGGFLSCVWALVFSFFVNYEKDPKYIEKMKKAREMEHSDNTEDADIPLPPKSKVVFGMEKTAWAVAFIVLIITAAHSCTNTFAILSMQKRGIEAYASNFFLTTAAGLFIGRAVISRFADKYGVLKITVPVYALAALSLIGIGTVTNGALVVALGLPYGLMFGTMASTSQALMVNSVMPERRAYASAMYLLAMDLAFGFSSILWGSVISIVGYAGVYAVAAICPIAAIIVVAFYWKSVGKSIYEHNKAFAARKLAAANK